MIFLFIIPTGLNPERGENRRECHTCIDYTGALNRRITCTRVVLNARTSQGPRTMEIRCMLSCRNEAVPFMQGGTRVVLNARTSQGPRTMEIRCMLSCRNEAVPFMQGGRSVAQE
jgi:hypothetical protein